MHFHDFCARNCDHHILLIITGNVHEESCHKLMLILVREQELKHNQNYCNYSGEMVVAFTIKKNYLMVSLFRDVMLPLSYLYLWYLVPNLAALLILFQA